MAKYLKKEDFIKLGYSPEFLDEYFSVQLERELNAVIKEKEYLRKYYYEHKKKDDTKAKTEKFFGEKKQKEYIIIRKKMEYTEKDLSTELKKNIKRYDNEKWYRGY